MYKKRERERGEEVKQELKRHTERKEELYRIVTIIKLTMSKSESMRNECMNERVYI